MAADKQPGWTPARRRAQTFPPQTIKEDTSGNSDVCSWAMIEMQRSLARAGMPTAQTSFYADLLWRCGPTFSWKPRLDRMAEDWGIARTVLSGKISEWERSGYIRRQRIGNLYRFSFPVYADLVEMVAANSTAHAFKGRPRSAVFGPARCQVKADARCQVKADAHKKRTLQSPLKGASGQSPPTLNPEKPTAAQKDRPTVPQPTVLGCKRQDPVARPQAPTAPLDQLEAPDPTKADRRRARKYFAAQWERTNRSPCTLWATGRSAEQQNSIIETLFTERGATLTDFKKATDAMLADPRQRTKALDALAKEFDAFRARGRVPIDNAHNRRMGALLEQLTMPLANPQRGAEA